MRSSKSEVVEVEDAVHLCIDVQNIFASGGLWQTSWMERVLPMIVSIVSRYQARATFTRASRG
ncbi:hypothetical protein SAMN05444164_3773 [Bradyrhizobium erythrophlei]|uniref:Isochorismatase family protein n=1 Tax=Bradyrhizobium erythrophlei TaxID=1437360 RepID=A0A1H4Y491_9BRAD|nr:hypothetical protein SAMN05444164_3773 [Bradyrhizobium erythrophlei]